MTSTNEFKARVMSSQTAALEEIENAYELITYELPGWLEAAEENDAVKEHLRCVAWLLLEVERSKAWLKDLFRDAKATLTRWSNILVYRTKQVVKAKLREFAPGVFQSEKPEPKPIASAELIQAMDNKPDQLYNNIRVARFLEAGVSASDKAADILQASLEQLKELELPEAKQLYNRLSIIAVKVRQQPTVPGKFLKL